MSAAIKIIRAQVERYQQTFEEMEAENLADSKGCRSRGMDSMADWHDGRAAAYKTAAASFAEILNTLDHTSDDGLS